MGFIIILLTIVMVVDCLFLILLVLMQLPKKDAGAGLAFGGAATDALFGAGSGNFLTKATKYGAAVFFVLAVLLSLLQSRYYHKPAIDFQRQIEQASQPVAAPIAPPATAPASTTPVAPAVAPGTNLLLATPAAVSPSNTPAAPAPQK
jgi:preprotein translocase subunit SecG